MKKTTSKFLAGALFLALTLSGCSGEKTTAGSGAASQGKASSASTTVLKIAASQTPHAELLEFVKPTLQKEGVTLKVTVLASGSGNTVLDQTEAGEFDVNYCGHLPWLKAVQSTKHQYDDLASAGGIHIEPIGCYSTKYTGKDQIPDNATIAIPNNTSNEYRALKILEQNGFIKLKSGVTTNTATARDIEKYIKPIKIVEMDAQIALRDRDQFDAYITNTNRVIEAGLDATKYLFRETAEDNPFANILVVKKDRLNDAAVKKLFAALTTPEVKKFIEEKYKGAVIPAF